MAQPSDGGPAFPGLWDEYRADGTRLRQQLPGMSLRDWFATHAPKAPEEAWKSLGLTWAPPKTEGKNLAETLNDPGRVRYDYEFALAEDIAWRYAWADAMLAAREATHAKT